MKLTEEQLRILRDLETFWQECQTVLNTGDGSSSMAIIQEQAVRDEIAELKEELRMCLKIRCRNDWVTADGYCETHREESHEKDLGIEEY